MRRAVAFVAILLALCVVASERAEAYVYWSDGAVAGSLGRAELSGSPAPGDQWLPNLAQGCGVAVDGSHVYWSTREGTIGRANLDGSEVNQSFIVLPTGWACGVAVDSSHLYWASNSSGKLGRAGLDGSNVQASWMSPGDGHGCGIAVSADAVYWATNTGVYRAPLSGGPSTAISTVTADNCGIAVNAAHVYWASGSGYIERSPLAGGPPTAIVQAPLGPCGVAVDAHYVYWGNSASDTIGRANLDGTGLDQRFAEGARSPCGVAVDSLGSAAGERGSAAAQPPFLSNVFRLGGVRKNRRRGTATLEVLLPGSGTVVLAGRKVKQQLLVEDVPTAAGATSAGPTAIEIPVRPRYRTRAALRAFGVVVAPLSVTFTPVGGVPKTRYTRIWLALRGAGGRGGRRAPSRP